MNTQQVLVVVIATTAALMRPGAGSAAPCMFAEQGDGQVTEIVDARSVRLADGREIKLSGIEAAADMPPAAIDALAALVRGRDVILRGSDDAPDRYGRQSAFLFVAESDQLVQRELLVQGRALLAADVTDRECAEALAAAEAEARAAGRGVWSSAAAIKSAESLDDILSGIGRFTIVEGKVLSVRQAGATTYLNFARNWTRGFAVTISKRAMSAFDAAGLAVKSLEQRRIRVRGWVESRPGSNSGPRIDVAKVGQIEILSSN